MVTSCNSTREELAEEFTSAVAVDDADGAAGVASGAAADAAGAPESAEGEVIDPLFEVVDWVRTYPVFRFAGVSGTKVCTLALRRR